MISPSLPLAGLLGLGGPEVVLVFIVVLLLFGGSKLPGLAKGVGQAMREFKKATNEEQTVPISEEKSPLRDPSN